MNTEHDLNSRLAREADRFFADGGHPLEMSQVLDRAGEIKRGRRMRASMLMAACVLAIAVPTVLIATGSHHDTQLPPAHQTKVDDSPLTIDGLKNGPEPKAGYVSQGQWKSDGGPSVTWASHGRVTGIAPLGEGAVVTLIDDHGKGVAEVITPSKGEIPGTTHTVYDLSGGLAVSDDGKVVGFVKPNGTAVVVTEAGPRQFMRIPRGTGFDAVAMTGECGPQPDDENPCAVWVQSGGTKPESWFVTYNAASTARTEYTKLADVRSDGRFAAGTTEVHDDLSTCSAVESPTLDEPGWTACGFQMVAFSPDDRRMLAQPDGDGLGPVGMAMYDAGNGRLLLDVRVAHQGYIRQMVWEDSSHVLATVYQDNQWAVIRIGLDGSREYAVPPVTATDDVDSPFVLPSR